MALEAALADLEEHKRKNANLETKLQQVQKQLEEETGKNRDLQQKLGEQSFAWNRRLGQEEGAVHELRKTFHRGAGGGREAAAGSQGAAHAGGQGHEFGP